MSGANESPDTFDLTRDALKTPTVAFGAASSTGCSIPRCIYTDRLCGKRHRIHQLLHVWRASLACLARAVCGYGNPCALEVTQPSHPPLLPAPAFPERAFCLFRVCVSGGFPPGHEFCVRLIRWSDGYAKPCFGGMSLNTARALFPGAMGPDGFISCFDHLIPESQLRRMLILKGGPGVGKSTFMRRVHARSALKARPPRSISVREIRTVWMP